MRQQLKEAAPAKILYPSGRIDGHKFEPPARLKHASPRALFTFHHCLSPFQCLEKVISTGGGVVLKNSDELFSFEYICALQLHPDHIRQGLMCWKDTKRKINSLKPGTNGHTKVLRTRYIGRSGRLSKAR
jgi:hypothetical protein